MSELVPMDVDPAYRFRMVFRQLEEARASADELHARLEVLSRQVGRVDEMVKHAMSFLKAEVGVCCVTDCWSSDGVDPGYLVGVSGWCREHDGSSVSGDDR